MKIAPKHGRRGFTLLEGLVALAVLTILVAVLFPMVTRSKYKSNRLGCDNNLKQIGIAFRIWEGDNYDKYPMDLSATNGGTQELVASGNVAICFQVMSNELATPKILICPVDSRHVVATNFGTGFSRTNISYFIGLNAEAEDPEAILSGDDNLVSGGEPASGQMINLATTSATWTSDRHQWVGNVLVADGSVQGERRIGSTFPMETGFATNSVVVP